MEKRNLQNGNQRRYTEDILIQHMYAKCDINLSKVRSYLTKETYGHRSKHYNLN